MRKIKNRLFCLKVSLLCLSQIYTQVTIGSSQKSNLGALLDLKEEGSFANNATASKGLGLPRVKLVRLESNDISETIDGITSGAYTGDHTGLLVYHADRNVCATIASGIYVWHGAEWQPLKENVVKTFVDRRDPSNPEEYKYASFGPAGEWMLENMRATTYQQGGTPPILQAHRESGESGGQIIKRYIYPFPSPLPSPLPAGATGATDGTDPYYFKQQRTMGLLYTSGAAMNFADSYGSTVLPGELDANSATEYSDTGEGEAHERAVGRQGICPNGWHVPTDKEWNRLEEEIYNNPEKYSTYPKQPGFVPALWDVSSWNPMSSWNMNRGSSTTEGHGYAMVSQCEALYTPTPITAGKSLSITQGGFNALLVGYYNSSGNELQEYGIATRFAVDYGPFYISTRVIRSDTPKIHKLEYKPFEMSFVRCKKN